MVTRLSAPNYRDSKVYGEFFMGLPPDLTTGNIWFVDSGHPAGADDSDGGRGETPMYPFATIDYAIGKCTASNGDIIYVAPGHTETIAAAGGITADVAGISIIGLGNASNRPLITLGTATTATFLVSATDVRIKNLRFAVGVDSLVKIINVAANYCTIEDCELAGNATYQATSFINITTTYDYTTIRRCTFLQDTDPAGTNAAADTGAIFIVDSEYVTVEECNFLGNFETAFIHNRSTLVNHLIVRNCYGYCALSDAHPYVLVANATGGDLGSLYVTPGADDVTAAKVFGTESAKFFVAITTSFGNDGAGGQTAVGEGAAT
jgi:hypothetical protein